MRPDRERTAVVCRHPREPQQSCFRPAWYSPCYFCSCLARFSRTQPHALGLVRCQGKYSSGSALRLWPGPGSVFLRHISVLPCVRNPQRRHHWPRLPNRRRRCSGRLGWLRGLGKLISRLLPPPPNTEGACWQTSRQS